MSPMKTFYTSATVLIGLVSFQNAYSSGTNTCPDLNTKTIATAACATKASPFLPGPLSKVKFAAKDASSCSTSLGVAKALQGVFKGDKTYAGTLQGAVTPGAFTCTYPIGGTPWQQALNTTHTNLVLTGTIPTRQHADYLNSVAGVRCPDFRGTNEELTALKAGSYSIEKIRDPKLEYNFKVGELKGGSLTGAAKNLFTSTPKLTALKGAFSLTSPYEMTCQYMHHKGGKETPFSLVGSNAGAGE